MIKLLNINAILNFFLNFNVFFRLVLLFLLIVSVSSCGFVTIRKISPIEGVKPLKEGDKNINDDKKIVEKSEISFEKVSDIIKSAEEFMGTPYKLGGNNKKGIDCSALMVNAFSSNEIKLPRTAQQQSKIGKRIKNKNDIEKGDLLFFATGKNKNKVTHVGLVYDVTKDDIVFIHASSSKGVRLDNLSNSYWKPRYLFATKVIK